jgi:hypothetical protein
MGVPARARLDHDLAWQEWAWGGVVEMGKEVRVGPRTRARSDQLAQRVGREAEGGIVHGRGGGEGREFRRAVAAAAEKRQRSEGQWHSEGQKWERPFLVCLSSELTVNHLGEAPGEK